MTAIRKVHQMYLQKNDLMGAIRIGGNNWVGVVLNTDGFRNYKINYTRMGSYFDTLKAVYLLDLSHLKLGLLVPHPNSVRIFHRGQHHQESLGSSRVP